MKTFVRRIGRVFLIIGIAGLLTFIGGATTLLGHPQTAHANPQWCPFGYHPGQTKNQPQTSCLPNAAYYCPQQGQVWSPNDNSCISEANNPNICNSELTKQDPDNAQQCIPIGQPCGSASYYDSASRDCIVQPPEPIQGGATTLLGHPQTAHANSQWCPFGYHPGQTKNQPQYSCLPDAAYYCPQQGQVWSPNDNSCISEANNPNICNSELTKQDPDNAQQCIPIGQPCGSASYYDSASGDCIVQPPEPIQ